jgi:hypothetical protein
LAHYWDGDDRDDAEGIDHVRRGRTLRSRCHVARADLPTSEHSVRKEGTGRIRRGGLWHEDEEDTHGELHVHEHRRRNRQDVVRVSDGEIGEERHAAPMELLEGERAQALDAEEHPEIDGQLHERQQHHGHHAHAGLLVHAALLERDALHRELILGLLRALELLPEREQLRLVRREHGGVAELLDGEGQQEQAREERACDDGVEPGQARRDVDQFEQRRGQAGGGPPGEPERCEITVLEGRERREDVEGVRLGHGDGGGLRDDGFGRHGGFHGRRDGWGWGAERDLWCRCRDGLGSGGLSRRSCRGCRLWLS